MGDGTDAAAGSRARMIEATIALLRGSGLSGAGINEIVRVSGAPKGSVYYFFPGGKQQIAAEALEAYAKQVLALIDGALAGEARPGGKVEALFAAFARRVEDGDYRRSCAFGTVSLDLDAELEGLRAVVAAAFSAFVAAIARHFDFGDAQRSESFAGLILTAVEGAYIRSRAERSTRAFEEAGVWLAALAECGAPGPLGLRGGGSSAS